MIRVVKTHQERKNELLDTAQALFYKQGYENTSVANVIDAVGIAKGTFYHYFKSKTDLLDQIVERIATNIDLIIDKVLEEPEENAIIELKNIYNEIGQYKVQEKNVLIMMTHALYSEDNIIMKTKLMETRRKTVAPRLAQVISRGVSEGLFHTGNPRFIAEFIVNMNITLSDKFADLVLTDQLHDENKKLYLELCETYNVAVEKILGAPENSIHLIDLDIISEFFE